MKDLFENDSTLEDKGESKEISGYTIYAPQQKARTVVNNLPEFYPELPDGKFDIIYCDPPYANTKTYVSAQDFNHEEFWETMRKWSKNNVVLITEENAPEDFRVVWSQQVSRSIKANDKTTAIEKLFIFN